MRLKLINITHTHTQNIAYSIFGVVWERVAPPPLAPSLALKPKTRLSHVTGSVTAARVWDLTRVNEGPSNRAAANSGGLRVPGAIKSLFVMIKNTDKE